MAPSPDSRRPAPALDFRSELSDISVMTEITAKKKLPAVVERFILHWGDMGDQWGVNRSVSQIHGLLYLAEAPMTSPTRSAWRGPTSRTRSRNCCPGD